MAPRRLADLIQVAETHEADIISDNMTVRSGTDQKLFLPESLDGGIETISLAQFAWHNRLFISGHAYGYLKPIIRRRFLEQYQLGYDASLRIGEDYLLIAELLARGARYLRHRSAGYVYTINANSLSRRLPVAAALAMRDADRRFLTQPGPVLDRSTRRAVKAHLDSLEDGLAFLTALEHLKRRRLGVAVGAIAARPLSARHFHMPIRARLQRLRRRP
jgi:succinoglycan biosynthesis protein ExoO